MLQVDVNVLVDAYREDAPRFVMVRPWFERALEGDELIGLSDGVLSGFLRVVTHPGIFDPPTPLSEAMGFIEVLRCHPGCVLTSPGRRHWSIFVRLCTETQATGNLIPDAYLAALAIESGSQWASGDRAFARFQVLRLTEPR